MIMRRLFTFSRVICFYSFQDIVRNRVFATFMVTLLVFGTHVGLGLVHSIVATAVEIEITDMERRRESRSAATKSLKSDAEMSEMTSDFTDSERVTSSDTAVEVRIVHLDSKSNRIAVHCKYPNIGLFIIFIQEDEIFAEVKQRSPTLAKLIQERREHLPVGDPDRVPNVSFLEG